MPDGSEIFPPVGYGGAWTAIAIVLLVAVAAWFAWVLLITRARPATAPGPVAPAAPRDLVAIRAEYLGRIAAVEHHAATGRLGVRQVHQELSSIVRHFVADTTGFAAHTMTLAELRQSGPPSVTALVAEYYVPEFADSGQGSAGDAIVRAREVVATWS